MSDLAKTEYMVLSLLLTQVNDRIEAFRELEDMERSFISVDEIEESIFVLERRELVSSSILSPMDQPLPDGASIELTPRGLAYCLAHEARVLRAAMGGSTEHLVEVTNAYDRIRDKNGIPADSTAWTGMTERLGAEKISQIRVAVIQLIEVIEQSNLDKVEKENALARARAIEELVNAPDPAWKEVVALLSSSTLNAFLNVLSLIRLILGF